MTTRTRKDVQEGYAGSAAEYDRIRLEDPRGALVTEHDTRLFLKLFPAEPGNMTVVEIGAGTGRFTVPALERGFSLTATDVNETMLERLRERIEKRGWTDRCVIRTEDIFNLSFADDSLDYVFALHVIPRFGSLEDQESAICEVARTMKPGGRFLFNYSNRSSFYGLFYKAHTATPSQMNRMLTKAGLRVETQRGKWIMNRSLVNRLPIAAARAVAAADRAISGFWPTHAWDLFVVAVKEY